ncbi:MAG: matrixin family metalloprotease [Myxococcales bacterium]|nr:matrixin family metalloprotease [Myxococcales bacterium]
MRPSAWLLAASLSLAASTGHGFCRTTTARLRAMQPGECATQGIPLSWRNRCTSFSLYNRDLPDGINMPDLTTFAAAATGAWARAACDANGQLSQYYRVIPDAPTLAPAGYNPNGANANTVAFRPRWGDDALHRPGAIAITVVTFDSFNGEIFDADIEMNSLDERTNPIGFRFSTEARPDPGAADLPTILTHEFGHFLGLSHSGNDRAVMWFEAGVGEARRDLTADDNAGVCTIYPQAVQPPGRCVGVPYGGLATLPGDMKVTGACNVSRRGTSATHLVWLSALAWAVSRRRKSVNAR